MYSGDMCSCSSCSGGHGGDVGQVSRSLLHHLRCTCRCTAGSCAVSRHLSSGGYGGTSRRSCGSLSWLTEGIRRGIPSRGASDAAAGRSRPTCSLAQRTCAVKGRAGSLFAEPFLRRRAPTRWHPAARRAPTCWHPAAGKLSRVLRS